MTARIQTINESTMVATVVPVLADDDGDALPPIPGVPVILPQSEAGGVLLELVEGDEVELIFADRSEDAFLEDGVSGRAPDSKRQHALSDARAYPGLLVAGETLSRPAGLKVGLATRDGGQAIYATDSDVILVASSKVRLASPAASDPVVTVSRLDAYLTELNAAIATGIGSAGGSYTPPPNGPEGSPDVLAT